MGLGGPIKRGPHFTVTRGQLLLLRRGGGGAVAAHATVALLGTHHPPFTQRHAENKQQPYVRQPYDHGNLQLVVHDTC